MNWFPESAAIEDYRQLGRPILCRPYALNPEALPTVSVAISSQPKVGFVGLPSSNRVTILSLLAILGCPLEIHGYGWDKAESAAFGGHSSWRGKVRRAVFEPHRAERIWRRVGWAYLKEKARGPLDDKGLQKFLSECSLILGLNETRNPYGKLESYLKFRDLEMPACGCCYLTQHNPDIARALEVGEEVLTFHNIFEARSLAAFYAKRPASCRTIGSKARDRILREHTWESRLRELQAGLR